MTVPTSEKPESDQREDILPSKSDCEVNNIDLVKTTTTGTTRLYKDGELRLIPRPSSDPRDPLNLPPWKKTLAILSLCFFGAMAFSAQQIVGTLLPVFVKEYATPMPGAAAGGFPGAAGGSTTPFSGGGAPPGAVQGMPSGVPGVTPGTGNSSAAPPASPSSSSSGGEHSASKPNVNALAELASFPGAPPLWRLNLLSSIPLLIVGVSNYFLVPLSIVIGRRPVIIVCAALAWVSAIWAGKSRSLGEHIAARSIQAIGCGSVESLVPFIVQDMTYIHQRSRAIGIIWASQGVVMLAMGIGSTYIVDRMGWRWLYHIIGIIGAVAFVMVVLFVPETRWIRSTEDLRGSSYKTNPETSNTIDYERFGRRTWKDDLNVFHVGFHPAAGVKSLVEIAQSLFFPNVLLIVLLNAAFIGISLASGQVLSPVLLAEPYHWPLSSFGLSVIGIFIASVFVWLVGGVGADKVANYITKKKGGVREPEVHLYNLICPIIIGIGGCLMFGAGGTYTYKLSWACVIIGLDFLNFAFLTINVIGSVYCIECFPEWAGPVLVNAASFRNIVGFGISFGVTNWVVERGYMGCFGIFAAVITIVSLGIVVLFIYGKRMRKATTRRFLKKTDHSS